MSTIYSLPLTNILVNGSKTYRLKTKDYDAILQHVEVESKTNDTINLNFEDLYFESIAFKGGSDLGETTLNCIRETMDVKNYYMVDSRPITCDESLKDEYLPELQFLVMRGYVIDIPMPGFATLDLNYQWRRSQTYDSPLEGYTLFESASNWHVGSGIAKCYLDVNGYDSGLIYYVAYGETNYDRLFMVGPNGETFTYPNSASPDNIANYKSTNFIDGRWSISYEKDGSVDREADRGYILIPNDISYSNEYVPVPITVDSISISGPDDITETGTYEFAATLQPSTADTYNLGWYIDDAPTGVVARIRWTADDPKRAYLEVDSIDEGVDSDITIVCYDDISGVEQSYNIRVRKEAQIYIQNIIISGPEQITNTGDYKYIVSYEPEDANKFNIDWDLRVPSGVTASILRGPTGDINGYLEVESIDPGVDATMEVICFDSVSGVEQSYSVNVKGEVIPIHIQNITISGPSQITEPGTYDYYATISPDNADEYDIDWDTIGFTDPHWYLQTDPEDPFHAQIVVPKTESFGSAFYLRCEDNVSFNYDRFSISMDVYVEPPVPEPEPLCLTSNSSRDCSFRLFSTTTMFQNLQYKLNDGEWTPLNTTDPITVPSHAKLYLKADRYYGWKAGVYVDYPFFVDWSSLDDDNTFDVSGELISIDSDTSSRHCFSQLFHNGGHINIKNAKDLILYNENTDDNAFYKMFYGNSHLITTPTLINSRSMNGCASMFRYCTALTSVELQHTYIGRNELNSMFANCTSLNYVSVPNLTSWDSAQTGSWLYSVSSTGTFRCKPELLDTIPRSSSGIPSSWTVDEYKTPLCFTALDESSTMYIPIASLVNPMLSTDGVNWFEAEETYVILANESVYMKADVCRTSSGSYFSFSNDVKASGSIMSLTGDVDNKNMGENTFMHMFQYSKLITPPKLPATTLSEHCYEYMFYQCTSLTTAPELPATKLTGYCYTGMFYGCTSLTTAPELPATTLVNGCYSYMFGGCTSLNYVKVGAKPWNTAYTSSWLSNVSSTGTLYKKTGVSIPIGIPSGIPSEWTVVEY